MLTKSEIQFLQGQKQVSKSSEYTLKSILRKKISNLLDRDLPLLIQLFPRLDLTKFSKNKEINNEMGNLTRISKKSTNQNLVNISINLHMLENSTRLNHNKLYNCQQGYTSKEEGP
jgi:hypothetical protein